MKDTYQNSPDKSKSSYKESDKKPAEASFKLKAFSFVFYIWPRPLKKVFAYFWTSFLYFVIKYRVAETKERVSKVFPEASKDRVNSIVFKSFYNLLLSIFELSYRVIDPKRLYKYTEVKNIDYIKEALNSNRPVFILGGHLANFENCIFLLGLEGLKPHLIAKRMRSPIADALTFEARELSGLVHIPPRKALEKILECINNKGSLLFPHDQYIKPPRGVKTKFLGLTAYTNSGLAKFAIKNKAMVIPINFYRDYKTDKLVVDVEQEIPLDLKYESEEENIVHMTQLYNDWLSKKIKEHPEDWMWIHRRFKTPRPSELVDT
jgi:KDO2-lipid IV(A) lauroyltransferase